jgi:hypothetical protein
MVMQATAMVMVMVIVMQATAMIMVMVVMEKQQW